MLKKESRYRFKFEQKNMREEGNFQYESIQKNMCVAIYRFNLKLQGFMQL